jgi:hypothetical protein
MFVTNNLLNPRMDSLHPAERKEFLWGLWRNQLEYAVESDTPAIIQILRDNGLGLGDFQDPDDLLKFPVITKQMFRDLGDTAFLPRKYRDGLRHGQQGLQDHEKLHVFPRFTGGSTVQQLSDYTLIRWSKSDWLGAMQSSTRGIREAGRDIEFPANAFANYTFDHIAAPFFTGVVIYNGGNYVPRHVNLSDIDALNTIKGKRCDGIISPPAAHQLKGRGLVELLAGDIDIDEPYVTRENIKLIIVSSTPLTGRIYDLFERRGIPVKDGGGSTDVGAVLWNCTPDPLRFHSTDGNVLNEVVDRQGMPVADGETGLFLCSRIAGVTEADPFLRQLYNDVQELTTEPDKAILPDDVRTRVSRVIGRDVLSLGAQELASLREGVEAEYTASNHLIPNQATQLLRYSGLMNETQYFDPGDCPCGKSTPKMKGLIRSYDYDGNPADLLRPVVLAEKTPQAQVSGYHLRLPDGCAIVER